MNHSDRFSALRQVLQIYGVFFSSRCFDTTLKWPQLLHYVRSPQSFAAHKSPSTKKQTESCNVVMWLHMVMGGDFNAGMDKQLCGVKQ